MLLIDMVENPDPKFFAANSQALQVITNTLRKLSYNSIIVSTTRHPETCCEQSPTCSPH